MLKSRNVLIIAMAIIALALFSAFGIMTKSVAAEELVRADITPENGYRAVEFGDNLNNKTLYIAAADYEEELFDEEYTINTKKYELIITDENIKLIFQDEAGKIQTAQNISYEYSSTVATSITLPDDMGMVIKTMYEISKNGVLVKASSFDNDPEYIPDEQEVAAGIQFLGFGQDAEYYADGRIMHRTVTDYWKIHKSFLNLTNVKVMILFMSESSVKLNYIGGKEYRSRISVWAF